VWGPYGLYNNDTNNKPYGLVGFYVNNPYGPLTNNPYNHYDPHANNPYSKCPNYPVMSPLLNIWNDVWRYIDITLSQREAFGDMSILLSLNEKHLEISRYYSISLRSIFVSQHMGC